MLNRFREVNELTSKTLEQVVDTEKATKDLVKQYAEKREALSADKERQIAAWTSEKDAAINAFQQAQVDANQKVLEAYQAEEKAKNDQEIQELKDKFKNDLPALVSVVISEVKNSYGNR